MGAWGGGLYEGDFACDLRDDFKGFLRAPLSDDEFLATIHEGHGLGHDGEHIDGFDYWLVLADQLERIGLQRPEVFQRAIAIIEQGEDIAALIALGAKPETTEERRRDTAKLLARLRDPRPAKPRKPLKKPQPLLFEPGDAFIWPTDKGNAFSEFMPGGTFEQDGWGFAVIKNVGHEYGVFAYFVGQILMWRRTERPTLADAVHCRRSSHYRGGMSRHDLRYYRIEKLGTLSPEELGPMPKPQNIYSHGFSLSLDAFNRFSQNKFPFPALSDTPIDADAPDQRPGMIEWCEAMDERRRQGISE